MGQPFCLHSFVFQTDCIQSITETFWCLQFSIVPISPPCNLTISKATATEITFTWEKCDCGTRGGAIQTYIYQLTSYGYETKSGETVEQTMSFEFDVLECTEDQEYEFNVAVKTSAGDGPPAYQSFRNDKALGKYRVVYTLFF